MITRWGVKNFKSILDAELELAPLTIFTGVNSSGKSAFLHSIVMLAQAARRKDKGIITLKGNLEDGDWIDLGSFDRIYNKRPSGYGIRINFTIPVEEDEDVHLELGLGGVGDCDYLEIPHGLLKCKEEKEDKNFSIEWGAHGLPDNASELYEELWRQTISSGDSAIRIDKIEVKSCNIDFGPFSFLPDTLCYKPCNLNSDSNWGESELDKSICKFTELLADIPAEKLTEEDAKKYTEKKLEEKFIELYPDSTVYKDNRHFAKNLFYFCSNYYWWAHNWNGELDERTVLFKTIPYFDDEEVFSKFKDKHDSGSEYFKIELSDWYQVLSNCNKYQQDAVKNELKSESKFLKSLRDNISLFQNEKSYLGFSSQLNKARDHLSNYFKYKIRYLAPLREDPKWKYPGNTYEKPKTYEEDRAEKNLMKYDEKVKAEYLQKISDVGVKGEKTPSVVHYWNENYKKVSNYYSPRYFEIPNYKPKEEEKLITALGEWVEYIGIANEIETEGSKKDNSFSLIIKNDKQEFALPQLGTGVSQVLPILVMCLAAPVGSTLIIEQPELHLHPKMQSRLADFFIAMSLSGRQCLIETHSEYFIEQLRYRIVMLSRIMPSASLLEKTKLYFVTKRDGISYFKKIIMNKYAVLDEWPDDFFEETQLIIDKIFDEEIKMKEAQKKNE